MTFNFLALESQKLPLGWTSTTLNEIAFQINPGFPSGKHNKDEKGIPHIRPMNINSNGEIDLNVVKYVQVETYDPLLKGDVLFNNTNSPQLLGKTTYIKDDTNWAYSNHMTRIRLPYFINSAWISYCLNYLFSQGFFRMNCVNHVNQASINSTFLSTKVVIPFPPLNEQKRIVSKLEELFTKLDAGVEYLKKTQILLKQYRQSVLKYAFEGKLTEKWREKNQYKLEYTTKSLEEIKPLIKQYKKIDNETIRYQIQENWDIPDGWVLTKLKDISLINPKIEYKFSDDLIVSFLPMRNVEEQTGVIDLSLTRKFSEVRKGYTPFVNDDIIFAKITPCMENGKIAIVNNLKNGLGFGSTEFHVIRLPSILPRKFLFFYLIREDLRNDAQRNMKGTAGQLRVPPRYLENLPIPFPSIPEQNEIVLELEKNFSIIENSQKIINSIIFRSKILRNSILKYAFEGKLVPQDPNDEPASILLEKIKQEKSLEEHNTSKSHKKIKGKQHSKQTRLFS